MQYTLLTTREQILEVIERHNRESEYVVVDIETTGLDTFKDRVIDVQISGFDPDSVFLFPGHLADCLRSLQTRVVGHGFRYDITALYRSGVDLTHWKYHDPILLGHLADENRESYSLDSYAEEMSYGDYKKAFWAKYENYQDAPEKERHEYAALDIVCTRALYARLLGELREQGIPSGLINDVHELQYALLRTEILGVKVDLDYTAEVGVALKGRIEALKPQMRIMVPNEIEMIELERWEKALATRKTEKGKAKIARPEFSFDSPQQLKTLLYDHLRLPPQTNEKTKAISTDYDSLQKIRDLHPIIGQIQEYRELEKVYGTYIEGTLERVREGRVYPEFRVNGTAGSRISHSNPNLGQLPKSGGIKGIYIPDSGEVFSDHDYGQLEVCIEAHFTQDKNLLAIVLDGASKHDITAHNLGISRDLAKTVNFASQYFCHAKKLAKILNCSLAEAQYQYNKYWETYAGVKAFKAQVDQELLSTGCVTDLFGRKRRFPILPSWEGDKAFRQGYNFKIQSTGGQIMNNAYYKASNYIRNNELGRGGMWTVHDSGLFSHKVKYADSNAEKVNGFMINEGVLTKLTVPLKVDYVTNCIRWMD